MYTVKLSTPEPLPILLVDATDGYTEEPGLAPVVTIRKAGGAFTGAGGAAPVDRGNGSYEYTPTAGELNTLGIFEYRATGAGARTYRGAVMIAPEKPGQLAAAAIAAATFAAGAINAAAIATDAIDGDAIAATAVTEIQTGLATAAALATVQADTDNIQTRLPAALVGGRMDASVGAMAADVVTAAAVAADAVAEVQAGLATAAGLTAAVAPLATAAGLTAAVAPLATSAGVTAAVAPLATSAGLTAAVAPLATAAGLTAAVAPLATAAAVAALPAAIDVVLTAAHGVGAWAGATASEIDTQLSLSHGAGAWGGASAASIASAVLQASLAANATAGSLAQGLLIVKGLVNGNVRHDTFTYVGGKLTGCRVRVYPTGADVTSDTNVIATFTVTAVNGTDGPTAYRCVQS